MHEYVLYITVGTMWEIPPMWDHETYSRDETYDDVMPKEGHTADTFEQSLVPSEAGLENVKLPKPDGLTKESSGEVPHRINWNSEAEALKV